MKILLIVIAQFLAVCLGAGLSTVFHHITPVVAAEKAYNPAEPELTMAQWIQKMNAKKTKCSEGEGGGGNNGYDSWLIRCEKGVEVYQDTTKDMQEEEAKINAHNAELSSALVSRCLTAKEFAEVTSLGYNLYVVPMQAFREEDVQSRFNAALQTQQILRQRCPR